MSELASSQLAPVGIASTSLVRNSRAGRRQQKRPAPNITGAGRVLVFLLTAILGFRLHELLPGPFAILKPALVIGVITFFVIARQSARPLRAAFASDRLLQLSVALMAWALLTLPFALVKGEALATVQATLPLIGMVAVFSLLPPTNAILDWVESIFVYCGASLAAALLFMGHEIAEGRVSVTYSLDPNDLAATLTISLMLAIGLALRSSGTRRLLVSLAIPLIGSAVLKTGSRGGVIGLAVGLVLLVIGSPIRKVTKRLIFLCALAACAWFAAPPTFRERMSTLFALEQDYNTQVYGGRQQIWQRGIGFGLRSPITGVGIGNFMSADGINMQQAGLRGKWSAAHNSFVQVFAELGFPGISIFMLTVMEILLVAWRASRSRWQASSGALRPELLAAAGGYIVCAFFLSAAYAFATLALISLLNLSKRTLLQEPRRSS